MTLNRVRLATAQALPFVGLGGPAPVPPMTESSQICHELSSQNSRLSPVAHVAALGRSPELAASPTRVSLTCQAAGANDRDGGGLPRKGSSTPLYFWHLFFFKDLSRVTKRIGNICVLDRA